MEVHLHRMLRLGPVRVHVTEHGVSSWGLTIGRWSWNARSRRHPFDTPGWGYVRTGGRC